MKTFRKPCFIGTQKPNNVNIKNKVQETESKNNNTKVAVGASLSRKKDSLCNTYYELLFENWIVQRFRFHASQIRSTQAVRTFATSHLVGCIKHYYNNLEDKVDKCAVATSY